jgi:V8-like Glu-specific endopeptidase
MRRKGAHFIISVVWTLGSGCIADDHHEEPVGRGSFEADLQHPAAVRWSLDDEEQLPSVEDLLSVDEIRELKERVATGVALGSWGTIAASFDIELDRNRDLDDSLLLLPDGRIYVVRDDVTSRSGGPAALASVTLPSDRLTPVGDGDHDELVADRNPTAWLPSEVTEGITGIDDRVTSLNQKVVKFQGVGECTGVYIGPRHILTAAHCIHVPGMGGFVPSEVYPGQNGECDDGSYACSDGHVDRPYGSKDVSAGWVRSGWDSTGDSEWDYGIIILQDADSWGHFYNFTSASPPVAPIEHYGYPSSVFAACVHSPEDDGTAIFDNPYDRHCGGFQYGQSSNKADQSSKFLYTWHDTQGGHSGGPAAASISGSYYVVGTLMGAITSGSLDTAAAFRRLDSSEVSWICGKLDAYPATGWIWHC